VSAVVVARNSLAELRSRRLVLTAIGLSAVFVGLFAVGFTTLYGRAEQAAGVDADQTLVVAASTLMTVLALYIVHFLTAFLAMFVAVGAVSGPAADGTLLAVLARPVARSRWLLGRWLAMVLLVVVYPASMAGALLLVARVVAGYEPVAPLRAAALLGLEGIVLVSLALWASSRWSTVTSGVVVFSLFGLGWLAGIIEFIGDLLANETMQSIGIVVSLLIPTDTLWRGASFYLQSPAFVALSASAGGGRGDAFTLPFAGNAPPSAAMLAWSVGYALVLLWWASRHFARRDL
jgi:Cu-processing system permease protein